MTEPTRLRNFIHLFEHRCGPSSFGSPISRVLRRNYECPACRAVWEPTGSGSWRNETNGTEGRIASVTMEYPDGTTQTFIP